MSDQGSGLELDIADKIKIAIEYCLMLYMTKQECLDSVSGEWNFNRSAVECVWRRLNIENPEFFNVYCLRMVLMKQIVRFNKLLSQQVEMMKPSDSMVYHPSSGQYISASNTPHTPNLHCQCSPSYGHHSCSDGYAQISQNMMMSQHGNESMFHNSLGGYAVLGDLFQPSEGAYSSDGYTQVSPNMLIPHDQNGSLFHPSAGVTVDPNGYFRVSPDALVPQNMAMAGVSNGYVIASPDGLNRSLILTNEPASQYTNNESFVQPSLAGEDFNGSVQMYPSLLTYDAYTVPTDGTAYDDETSNLKFIPTPHTRNATTFTSLLASDRQHHSGLSSLE